MTDEAEIKEDSQEPPADDRLRCPHCFCPDLRMVNEQIAGKKTIRIKECRNCGTEVPQTVDTERICPRCRCPALLVYRTQHLPNKKTRRYRKCDQCGENTSDMVPTVEGD